MKRTVLLAIAALSSCSWGHVPFLQSATSEFVAPSGAYIRFWYGPGGYANEPNLYNGPTVIFQARVGNAIGGRQVSWASLIPNDIIVAVGPTASQLAPFSIQAVDSNGTPIAGINGLSGMHDPRTETEKAAAPKFGEILVRTGSGFGTGLDGVVSGKITNAGGDPTLARVEFYNGDGWISLNTLGGGGIQPDGRFRGFFRSGTNPPMIRVFLPGLPNNYGYASGTTSSRTNYPALRPSLSTPNGPRSRFDLRSRTTSVGTRG